MSTRIPLLLTCLAACSAPVRSDPVERVQRVVLSPPAESAPAVVDSGRARAVKPAVDLSGAWTTGSTNEPDVRQFVVELQCNYTPSFWVIEQSADTVRAWTNPASHAQGIARRPEPRPMPAEGRISGVNVTMKDASSRYVLRYDAASGHLRGTLNGAPFWAIRQQLVSAKDCIAVP